MTTRGGSGPQLGLRQNLAQFALLVGVNALVGGMIGQERTVLPLLAEREFHLTAFTAALTFIAAFGAVKAATNFLAWIGPMPLIIPEPRYFSMPSRVVGGAARRKAALNCSPWVRSLIQMPLAVIHSPAETAGV